MSTQGQYYMYCDGQMRHIGDPFPLYISNKDVFNVVTVVWVAIFLVINE